MAAIEAQIPAFSMWKMFNETVPYLLKGDCSESIVTRLANIIQSKEFSNIFLYNKEAATPSNFTQYQLIVDKYKSFTTWILGQFFYLTGCEKLANIQNVIIDVQLYILEQLETSHLHIYNELATEYCKALDLLVGYYKSPKDNLVLEVFIPSHHADLSEILDLNPVFLTINSQGKCCGLIGKLIKFFGYILLESFTYYSFDEYTYKTLDNLQVLLSGSSVGIQLEISQILVDLLETYKYCHSDLDENIRGNLREMSSIFEQIVYDIYNKNLETTRKDLDKLEETLLKFFKVCSDYKMWMLTDYTRFSEFICMISLEAPGNPRVVPPGETLVELCAQEPAFQEKLSTRIQLVVKSYNSGIFRGFKEVILRELLDYRSREQRLSNTGINAWEISKTWCEFHKAIIAKEIVNFSEFMHFLNRVIEILIEIKLEFKLTHQNPVVFFEEGSILLKVLTEAQHSQNCLDKIHKFLINNILVSNSNNLDIIFHFITYPLLKPEVYTSDQEMPCGFIGKNSAGLRKPIKDFYAFLSRNPLNNQSTKYLTEFFLVISSGILPNLNKTHLGAIEKVCEKLWSTKLLVDDVIIEKLPHVLTLFRNTEVVLDKFLALFSKDNTAAIRILPEIICASSSDFTKVLTMKQGQFSSVILCDKCYVKADNQEKICAYKRDQSTVPINFSKTLLNLSTISTTMLKHVLQYLTKNQKSVKEAALETLPCFSNHILKFHSTSVLKIWIELLGDPDVDVRKKLAGVVYYPLEYSQGNAVLSLETKQDILRIFFECLLRFTKKSLRQSDFSLQDTLLDTLEEVSKVQGVTTETLKVLIYFVMVPTSKYSLVAVNKCFQLAKNHQTNLTVIYGQNRQELCELIVNLCCVNQALVEYTLSMSLVKLSVMLGFYGTKDFVSQESAYLLPFFVAKLVKVPAVSRLIQEVAQLVEMDLPELLASKYGNIFVHVFLNDEGFNKSMEYLEKTTEKSGPVLRKRNFRVILNELLVNFHEKRERVLLALKLLAQEDPEHSKGTIPDYLQSQFLGILVYFDIKLIGQMQNQQKILQSLADILRFMGPKHIVPLRFKLIAMLRSTKNYDSFPKLKCEVWDAFIRRCDVELLGPQLATIFVSTLPLLEPCPEINDIYKYLVVSNEKVVKDYIADLFFVNNPTLNPAVLSVIQKYLKPLENQNLQASIRRFLKYLNHETIEVRLHALSNLRGYLEKSREELDRMILGYNGIDPMIVELIEVLTLGCREKDEALKLACGEVIGVLGAVEPSQLPRHCLQNDEPFTFFIFEDSFIQSALNELLKAFQTDKNTQNLDRFALAIQEILKTSGISPDETSSKHELWLQFSEAQKQVMLPLLSSRYMMTQPIDTVFSSPIYGSNVGASFQDWLCNWTCSLISTLPNDRQSLLQVCWPSMRQDHRILMHFLPHILLHSLLEGTGGVDKAYLEFTTITSSFKNKKKLDDSVLNVRPLPIPGMIVVVSPEHVKQMQCTKVVFVLLDFLDRCVREWRWQNGVEGISDTNYVIIKNFLSKFSKFELAKCNYQCGEYPRALMYLEEYVTENPGEILAHLTFLAEIYAQLDEPDGVEGVTALQHTEPSVEQRILALEVSGKLADAAACYERMSQPLKLHHIQGLIQCYLDLDNVNTALNFAQGALGQQVDFGNMLLEMQAEPFWRLGRYDDLATLLDTHNMEHSKSWGVLIGKALLHFKDGKRDEFKTVLDALKRQQVDSFGAASLEEGAYQHGYNCIARLHALNELQQIERTVHELLLKPNDGNHANAVMHRLMNEWELRIKVVQESVRIVEPLLCLRRVSLDLGKSIAEEKVAPAVPFFQTMLGECWLLSATTARAAGVHQQAYTYTLKAEGFAPPKLFLEKAKLHWLREEHDQALTTLRRGVEIIHPEGNSGFNSLSFEQRKILAEAKLLIASYNADISNVDAELNIQYYKDSIKVFNEWEKSLVCLGQYLDKIFQNYPDDERDSKGSDIQIDMIHYFGKSLQYGTKYVYQSMPRLLSIWFDYGTRLLELKSGAVREERKRNLLKMTKLIDTFLERLPAYVFLTAFSQLVSRICHPQREVYLELKSIIIKLVQQYPQQCLWTIISVMKSSYATRSKRCSEILDDSLLKTQTTQRLVRDFTSLAEKLIELCNKQLPPEVTSYSVSAVLRALPRLLSKDDFSQIMIPTQKLRKLILPNPDFKSTQHNPFPNHYVYIVGIEDEMTILQSLQHPRKITLRASDGLKYIFMLKPKDDLRKDFRLMEFNDIVNQLLSREPEARQRRLNIRLYSVAPLNEECGLIEWVPNLVGLRPVLVTLYKKQGLGMRNKQLRSFACNIRDPLAKKRDIFLKQFLPKYPPVLGDWFRKTFPDAQSWLTARTCYIRTTAVMSMAGYILGLGDRHGENILLDSKCGDAVHVDFNCLFNKGETFEWPERVPFRLTQNMVAAMGPLGIEGVFRKSCACTLRVLRNNSNTLMSIVRPFVYDPLVSWPRHAPSTSTGTAERTNELALEYIKNIELRLQGVVKIRARSLSIPLSVEGQTNNLINEAMDVDNLCQMYVGWGPYL